MQFQPKLDPNGDPTPAPSPYNSACWLQVINDWVGEMGLSIADLAPGYARGSRLNYNLLAAPSPGDFLSPAATVGETSVCLLPPGAASTPTDWQGVTRPTLDGVVDLITGLPLVKVTDLELPLDGATFRLTRTRSGNHRASMGGLGIDNLPQPFEGIDRWWDWTGSGWMASENPLLLIDAALPDATGDGPRTTWLWIDAHHSIPFQQVYHPPVGPNPARMSYEAPPRFRARLEHNGVWAAPSPPTGQVPLEDSQTGHWGTPPTQFDIWLYDGLIHYTFVAVYDDVPPNRWDTRILREWPIGGTPEWANSSYHDKPILRNELYDLVQQGLMPPDDERATDHWYQDYNQNPGLGVPYFGLCVKVEDQSGHTVETSYCDLRRVPVDDPASGECVECAEDGPGLGQIKYIKLKTNGTTRWTLLYAHRRFAGFQTTATWGARFNYLMSLFPESVLPLLYEIHGYSAIDRIYVYPGDLPESVLAQAELNVNHFDTPSLDWDSIEPLNDYNSHLPSGASPLPTDWQYQVQYHYDTPTVVRAPDAPTVTSTPPVLLKTTVRTRAAGATSSPAAPDPMESVKRTVYVYQERNPANHALTPWLWMVFNDDDLTQALRDRAQIVAPALTENDIALWQNSPPDPRQLEKYASLRLESTEYSEWPQTGSYNIVPPFGSMFSQGYLRPDSPQIWNDGEQENTVGLAVIGSITGRQRVYRLHRAIVPPVPDPANPDQMLNSPEGVRGPERSIFAHPFAWASAMPGGNYSAIVSDSDLRSFADAHDLSLARWISVVDEFPLTVRTPGTPGQTAYDELSAYYDQNTAVKPGQLSRRVVEMNPAGFILRDRHWEFTADGTITSGGGLGQQYVYKKVSDLFTTAELGTATDTLKNELVLTEHRSVGWSAADAAHQGDADGLVDFRTYHLVDDTTVEGQKRLEDAGAGIQRGAAQAASDSRMFEAKHLSIYDETNNVETDIRLEFLRPVQQAEYDSISAPASVTLAYLTGLPAAGMKATVAVTAHSTTPDPDQPDQLPRERRALQRLVISPPHQLRPGGDWFFPVEKEWYDDSGNVTWSASGVVHDPFMPAAAPDPLDSLTFTFYSRYTDGYGLGQPRHTVLDATPGPFATSIPNESVTVGDWPESSWSRLPAMAQPKPFITSFLYDWFGLSDMLFPSGMRWAHRVILIPRDELVQEGILNQADVDGLPGWLAREYTFNDLVPDSNGTTFTTQSPGKLIDHGSARPESPLFTRQIELPGSFPINFDYTTQPQYNNLAAVQLAFDGSGHVRVANMLEWVPGRGWSAQGTKEINDLGEVYRELELDGTITRTTRDSLGKDLRTYRGTEDEGWECPTGSQGQTLDYDMVLVERTEYGSGVHDAWLPTVSRSYTNNPSWARDHYGTPPTAANDLDGIATITGYDWRMRPVRADSYLRGDPATSTRDSTTLTYFDHLNRPCLVATFGRGDLSWVTGALDPTTLGNASDVVPPATAFYGHAIKPLSLVQMSYGPDGAMTEKRNYDVAWNGTGSLPYQSEFQYFGPSEQEVFTQRPSEPVTITRLDSQGRTAAQASVAPGKATGSDPYGYELTRTDYLYDRAGNAVDVARWERVLPTSDSLDLTNAVRSRTVSWYDRSKRLLATAELGTEQSAGYVAGNSQFIRYTQGATPPDDFNAPAPTLNTSTGVIDRAGIPAGAQLQVFAYDKKGNQTCAADSRGAVTVSEYSGLNRLMTKTEDAFDADPAKRRKTEYTHFIGRLTTMKAWRSATQADVTQVDYGADIVDDTFTPLSRDNGLIGRMWLPNPADGSVPELPTSSDPDVTLRYTFEGRVAERVDARGVVFRYCYDDVGRLKSTTIGHYSGGVYADGYPDSMTLSTGVPVDRIGYIQYTYDDRAHLATVTAAVSASDLQANPPRVVAQTQYSYSDRGSLISDYQSYGALVAPLTTPKTEYAWDYQASGDPGTWVLGHHRLSTMTYPTQLSATRRVLTFGYGSPTGTVDQQVSDQLSRMTGITSNLGTPTSLAAFTYSGTARRASLSLAGGKVAQQLRLASEIGLGALDSFGRVADLNVRNAGGATLFRAQYTYDAADNRLSARLTQVPVAGQSYDNVRSQLNGYDGLERLASTAVGALDSTQTDIQPGTMVRRDNWNLDLLGNWVGGDAAGTPGSPGRFSTGNLDGWGTPWVLPGATAADDTQSLTHSVNERNQLLSVDIPETGSHRTARYDAAGNLIFDGTYYYQYDAWNRLIQVNQASSNGGPTDPVVIGVLVKQYSYDGLGRLARTLSPYPAPGVGVTQSRTERFYYDGIRRIQELVIDPVQTLAAVDASGDPTLVAMRTATVDPTSNPDVSSAPMAFESAQLAGGGIGGGGSQTNLDREYVWGPGGTSAGIDELLVQYDHQRNAWWVVQDEGGDVAALCDLGAAGDGRVVAQFTYDAYGSPLSADHLYSHPLMHCGHKALFSDRLDVGVVNSGGGDSPRIVPFAQLICHDRNRVYIPQMGRFLQQDPNASAMTLLSTSALHGMGMDAIVAAFDMAEMYGNGGNLYQYLGSSPWRRHDAMGLNWDPFSMVDDFVAESTGSAAALLDRLTSSAKTAAYVAAVIASQLPFPIGAIAGDLAASALEGGVSPDLAKARKILGVVNLGIMTAMVAKLGYEAITTAVAYIAEHGLVGTVRNLWSGAKSLTKAALGFFKRKEETPDACGCFAGGTVVWTIAGLVPIAQVHEGDLVVTRDSSTGLYSYQPVTREIVTRDAALLELTISSPTAGLQRLQTTDEHPFFSECRGWVRADSLEPGELVRSIAGDGVVESLEFSFRRTTVYNLVVAGSHNYHVGIDGILVHNCPPSILQWSEKRFDHVHLHGSDELAKDLHGVFEGDPVLVTEEAWYRGQRLGIQPVPQGSRLVYEVPMGRTVGWEGGALGSGNSLSTVKIVVQEDGTVVTAFPIKP